MVEYPLDLSKVIELREAAHDAIGKLVDAAGSTWFDLGEKLAERRFLDILDKLENSLLDSEEDAIMTIHLIRKMVESDDRE
jgi:hypothetical protein